MRALEKNLLTLFFLTLTHGSFCQMTKSDSLIESYVHYIEFDCYDNGNSYRVFKDYSNGQVSTRIYNLPNKDSIVQYYFDGKVGSIGIYYGCIVDTLFSTNYVPIIPGNPINSHPVEIGEEPKDHSITLDSIRYMTYSSYELVYRPIYDFMIFDKSGLLLSKTELRTGRHIIFSELKRTLYLKQP